jgi:hypothetical protein
MSVLGKVKVPYEIQNNFPLVAVLKQIKQIDRLLVYLILPVLILSRINSYVF